MQKSDIYCHSRCNICENCQENVAYGGVGGAKSGYHSNVFAKNTKIRKKIRRKPENQKADHTISLGLPGSFSTVILL